MEVDQVLLAEIGVLLAGAKSELKRGEIELAKRAMEVAYQELNTLLGSIPD